MALRDVAAFAGLLCAACAPVAGAQELDIYPPYRTPAPPERRPAVSAWAQFLPVWRLRGEQLRSCGTSRRVKVTLSMTFAPDGRLTRSDVVAPDLATQVCVAERVRRLRLPPVPESPPRFVLAVVRLSRTRVDIDRAP